MAEVYNGLDLCDLYRGTLSLRRVGVLVRQLPMTSRLVTAMNDGNPKWTHVEHLLADLWALTVSVNVPRHSLPNGFDHPRRAEESARTKTEHLRMLKAVYMKRRASRSRTMKNVAEVSK